MTLTLFVRPWDSVDIVFVHYREITQGGKKPEIETLTFKTESRGKQ